jgi:hypothetical protein
MKHLVGISLLCLLGCSNANEPLDLVSTANAALLEGGTAGQAGSGNHAGGSPQGGSSQGGSAGCTGCSDCWKDVADTPYGTDAERNAKALLGAAEGFDAAVAQHGCAASEAAAMCYAGIWTWPNGLRGFCVRSAAWASALSCAAVEAQACTPGMTVIIATNNTCTAATIPPMCVWARAWACAYAQAYAFAWACAGTW